MIQKGDRFRRQLDASRWEVAAISRETLKPGESETAVLVPADGGSLKEEVPVVDLENEVGWMRIVVPTPLKFRP